MRRTCVSIILTIPAVAIVKNTRYVFSDVGTDIPRTDASCKKKVCESSMKLFHQAVKASNSSKSRNSKSDGSSGGNKTDGPAATTPSPEENDTTKESNKIIAALRELSEDSPVEADSGCPVNVEQLGTATWTLLHTIAAYFPDEPSEADRRKAAAFIESLAYLYPCEVCAEDFRESVKRHPPRVSSRTELVQWCCELHNEVNKKLGKPTRPCSLAALDERWRDGGPRCEDS